MWFKKSQVLIWFCLSISAFGQSVVNIGPEGGDVLSIAVDPNNSKTMYAATRVGVFRSNDAGGSWSNAGLNGFTVDKILIDPLNTATIYAIRSFPTNVFKTVDAGVTWNQVDSGLIGVNCCLRVLAIDPQTEGTIYAGIGAGGQYPVMKSTDGGTTWNAAG
jgi:photosystem II stability/assembly factor-like uncharacterized protein